MVDFIIDGLNIPDTIQLESKGILSVILVFAFLGVAAVFSLPRLLASLFAQLLSVEVKEVYQQVILPCRTRLSVALILVAADLFLLLQFELAGWLRIGEFALGLAVALAICISGFGIFKQFFEVYLLDLALRSKRIANSELLVLIKFFANTAIIFIVAFVFAQTHRVNVVGLVASVGLGGVAIAFASQKVLEQVLWTFLLYLDRPFVSDDYIHLDDGTFGRVESVGWRSTKVRLSGKGTLVVIPNSILAQMAVENLSGAKKTITILNVIFEREIPDTEKALVRKIIAGSTQEIYGIDHRLTEVAFQKVASVRNGKPGEMKAQVRFFILGSGEVAMELRQQLLDTAHQNVTKQLRDYGIGFKLEDEMVNIDSPMNI